MKINYDRLMMDEIESLDSKKKLLLHSCCGPCSSSVIERLKDYFDLTVIYYNPNIEPKEEYEKRKDVQIKFLERLGISYIEAPYENNEFRKLTNNLAGLPEGGSRCMVCYGLRLKYTANIAKKEKFDYFTTTLTVSPHKNADIINKIGISIGEYKKIKYLPSDFKKRDGYKRSIELCKKFCLYRQNYCGCLYAKGLSNDEG